MTRLVELGRKPKGSDSTTCDQSQRLLRSIRIRVICAIRGRPTFVVDRYEDGESGAVELVSWLPIHFAVFRHLAFERRAAR